MNNPGGLQNRLPVNCSRCYANGLELPLAPTTRAPSRKCIRRGVWWQMYIRMDGEWWLSTCTKLHSCYLLAEMESSRRTTQEGNVRRRGWISVGELLKEINAPGYLQRIFLVCFNVSIVYLWVSEFWGRDVQDIIVRVVRLGHTRRSGSLFLINFHKVNQGG